MSEYVKHEILLPKELSEKIPKGSELVFRPPKISELHIDDDGHIDEMPDEGCGYPYIVIEPAWTAPDWMPRGWWLAMDADGEWFLYETKPEFLGDSWYALGSVELAPFNWTPPSVDGAEDSLRQI